MSLLLTLNYFISWSSVSIVNFEQVIGRREYISIICNYNIWLFYNIGNYIVKSNYNISVLTVKVTLLFHFFTRYHQPNQKQDSRLNFFNSPFLPFPFFKQKVLMLQHSYAMKQGSKINRLPTTLNKLFGRHLDVFPKYNNTSLEFAELLLEQYDNVILHNLII